MKSFLFKRLFLLAVVAFSCQNMSLAYDVNYYYNVTVKSNNTGQGKVYVSEESHPVNNQGVVENVTYVGNTGSVTYSNTNWFGSSTQGKSIYVYAKPESGYAFNNWTITNGSGATVELPQLYSSLVTLTSKRNTFFGVPYGDGSMTCTIQANFVQVGLVRTESNNNNWGSAYANPVNNRANQNVTITAVPKITLQGVKFLYWEKIEQGGSPVILENSSATMTVRATSTPTTYKAYFSPPTEVKGVYCRIKNKATNSYLVIYNDAQIEQKSRNVDGNDVVYFDVSQSLKMVSGTNALTNPGAVIFISGEDDGSGGLLDTDMKAQTVSTRSSVVVQEKDGGKVPVDVTTVKHTNGYRFTFSGGGTPYYLSANSAGNVTFENEANNNSLWDIEIFDRGNVDNVYFGVAPKNYFCMTNNGVTKYYTTLYTSFPYELMDGVTAYWIEDVSKVDRAGKKITLTEIPTGEVVPGMRAVVLECSTYGNAKQNRLFPVYANASNVDTGTHILHGDCLVKHNPSEYEGMGTFYILSVKTTNPATSNMGFYTYKNEIPINKAFVLVPTEDEAFAKSVTLEWGEEELFGDNIATGIDGIQLVFPNKKDYYDLQGRKVEHPQKGVYIVNGKKVVVK